VAASFDQISFYFTGNAKMLLPVTPAAREDALHR
jgi:hypothetical protein